MKITRFARFRQNTQRNKQTLNLANSSMKYIKIYYEGRNNTKEVKQRHRIPLSCLCLKWEALLPGPSRRLAPVIKCSPFLSFFQRYIVRIYRWLEISLAHRKFYPPFWKARGIEDSQQKDYSFLGNDTFPSLYDAQVYEHLRVNIWRKGVSF